MAAFFIYLLSLFCSVLCIFCWGGVYLILVTEELFTRHHLNINIPNNEPVTVAIRRVFGYLRTWL